MKVPELNGKPKVFTKNKAIFKIDPYLIGTPTVVSFPYIVVRRKVFAMLPVKLTKV